MNHPNTTQAAPDKVDAGGTRYYHGTNVRLAIGELLHPGMPRKHSVSSTDVVYVTNSLPVARAYSLLAANARRGGQCRYVYEVEPHSTPINDKYRNEFTVSGATVVDLVVSL